MRILPQYKGAGILFACDSEVLLGLRAISPFKNRWSIFAGRMEAEDSGVFCKTAFAEASEEACNCIPVEDYLREYLPTPFNRNLLVRQEINLPFFKFVSFVVQLTAKPSLKYWPRLNSEFLRCDWFKMDSLPNNLHPFVKTLVRRLRAGAV
jgi:8-oxo-dGTP pyrophosphatase MutT (NUDIX family)